MNEIPIEFWFEFASTYSYVGIERLPTFSAPFVLRPFLLGPVFAAQGLSDSPFNVYPVKGRYMRRDMERLCAEAEIPFRWPSVFPRGSLLATRIAIAHDSEPWLLDFCRRVYRANFAEDRAIDRAEVIQEIAEELHLPFAALRASAERPETKQALREQTARASELGIFGAPTLRVGDELFWGSDRMDHALRFWTRQGAMPARG